MTLLQLWVCQDQRGTLTACQSGAVQGTAHMAPCCLSHRLKQLSLGTGPWLGDRREVMPRQLRSLALGPGAQAVSLMLCHPQLQHLLCATEWSPYQDCRCARLDSPVCCMVFCSEQPGNEAVPGIADRQSRAWVSAGLINRVPQIWVYLYLFGYPYQVPTFYQWFNKVFKKKKKINN